VPVLAVFDRFTFDNERGGQRISASAPWREARRHGGLSSEHAQYNFTLADTIKPTWQEFGGRASKSRFGVEGPNTNGRRRRRVCLTRPACGSYLRPMEGNHVDQSPETLTGFARSALRTATFCGALPLVSGTLIYLCWRVTRWDWLMVAGFITLLAGLMLFFVGAVSLLAGASHDIPRESIPGRRWRLQVSAIGCLLFLNFPAAAFYLYSADDVLTRTTVDVINDSPSVIESFVLEGPGVQQEIGPLAAGQQEIGPLAAGQQIRRHLHFRGKGTLQFVAKSQGIEFRGTIEGYVCSDIGERATVRVTSPKNWRIEHRTEPEWEGD
jgi:hypothetical protein